MPYTPRRGRATYIQKLPSGAYVYRRSVPVQLREVFGCAVWHIALSGTNDLEREQEAAAHALRHTRLIQDVEQTSTGPVPTLPLRAATIAFGDPGYRPIGRIWRHGDEVEPRRAVVTDDPAERARALAAGKTVLSHQEWRLQAERLRYVQEAAEAPSPADQRAASRMASGVAAEIDEVDRGEDTLMDLAERWFTTVRQSAETQ